MSNIAVTLVDQETTLCSNGIKRNICVSSHLNYEQNGYAFVRLWLTGLYAALAQRSEDLDVTMSYNCRHKLFFKQKVQVFKIKWLKSLHTANHSKICHIQHGLDWFRHDLDLV